ncbi:cardiolipin synthase B [Dictyobacter vulcani]|uniref:phospholipase D n=1 Tax=Dictyobacter vulcani TaxID=2607529 RepID=A0A5J4KFQ6_9CHLR|nr:phospholipase D-like domain-containing protein [Dictyobacter vulcani]GER86483.1 cardiolipin synthase B [Dictyobacter vulcani]
MHSKRHSHQPLLVISILTLIVLAVFSNGILRPSTAQAQALLPASLTLGTGRGIDVTTFVEPAAGETPILNAINNATSSIYVELYLLTDTNVINALENAAKNGKDVRVMLDPNPYGVGSSGPAQTLQALSNAGAQTKTSNPIFTYTHEKSMVIDGKTAYIMTCNLTKSALGGSTSTTNREYGIIDTESTDVAAVLGIFTADWNRSSYTLTDNDLVLSPVNSRSDFIALINQATSSLKIEAEEMQDTSVEQAIVNAEARGVNVQVILPANDSGNTSGIATLKSGHVLVYTDAHYYMHAKLIIVDGGESFVGSENISTNSLDNNRELGILISKASVITILANTFSSDLTDSVAA